MSSMNSQTSGGKDLTNRIDEIKNVLGGKTIRPLKKFRSLVDNRYASNSSKTNMGERLGLSPISKESLFSSFGTNGKTTTNPTKKRLNMVNNDLKLFDNIKKSNKEKSSFSTENELKKSDSSSSKDNKSVNSDIISSNSLDTPKEILLNQYYSCSPNDVKQSNNFCRNNSSIIKSKFSENTNNVKTADNPFEVNNDEIDNIFCQESSFDSFDVKDQIFRAGSINNNTNYNSNNENVTFVENEIETEFEEIIEIFEDFNSNKIDNKIIDAEEVSYFEEDSKKETDTEKV